MGFAQACAADDLPRLFERPPASDPRLTTSRLATLTIGLAVIPIVLAIEALNGSGGSWVTLGFTAAIGLLVLGRIAGLFRSRDQIAAYNRSHA